jgi:tetratricopeptide (TPR) repeat protein
MHIKQEFRYSGEVLGALVLLAATLLAYQQVWHAGFIWDDDAHVTRPGLQGLHGLWRIWHDTGATQQYYPVLSSAFWLEHLAWGDAPAGYHLANILFHAVSACLLYRVLRRLELPGAWIAACVFALHPVNAESVAWISEQKNTLSAAFYFAAALAYLRYESGHKLFWYAAGTGLFVLALLTKSVTATLPAALLVVLWWKRGRLSLTGDLLPLVPWLALGASMGAMTAWLERTHVGAIGPAFDLGAGARLIVAGRALWFYLGKILWPANLTFIYPRWVIEPGNILPYAFPAAALAALAWLWALRNRTRAPLATALLFAGTLFPALGFLNVFPFLYSFVADHFQYLAMAMVVSALAAAGSLGAARLPPGWRAAAGFGAAGLIAALAVLTWRQCAMYSDVETLWRATLARNPSCWMAYNNLASGLLGDGRIDEAITTVQSALKLDPDNAAAHATLGEALARQGRRSEAFEQFARALEIEPNNAAARIDLGAGLLQAGRFDEAIAQYRAALGIVPDSAKAKSGLGDAFLRTGRLDEAIAQYGNALEDDPTDASAQANLGTALMQKGLTQEAIAHYRRAVDIDPRFAAAQFNLGNALLQSGRRDDALSSYARALEIEPNFALAHANMGLALLRAGRLDEAILHLQRSLELEPGNSAARENLAEALSRKQPAR